MAASLGPVLRIAFALLILVASGCGRDERDAARDRVDAYVEREQELMRSAQPGFDRANRAYGDYAAGRSADGGGAKDLRDAERSIAGARDRLLALDVPGDARALHDRLVEYFDLNVELAGESTRLARYLPAARRALRPLPGINRRLQADLDDATDSTPQAAALERFARRIRATASTLSALEPPALLEAPNAERIRRLGITERLARRLRRALLDGDAGRVAALLERFRSASGEDGSDELIAEQAAARYARRLDAVREAAADVRREQRKLDQALR
jgi:hypothetical protein